MKVYVVTTGSYSDFGIYGIYSSKEIANKVMNKICNNDKSIHEYDLDKGDQSSNEYLIYEIIIDKDGGQDIITESRIFPKDSMTDYGDYYIILSAKDINTAMKIARERHSMFLANNLYQKDKTINYFTKEEMI